MPATCPDHVMPPPLQAYFHPLCGRRAGNYLVARAQPGSRVFKHRAYCHNHSEAQRNKDYCTGAAARVSPQPGFLTRGWEGDRIREAWRGRRCGA